LRAVVAAGFLNPRGSAGQFWREAKVESEVLRGEIEGMGSDELKQFKVDWASMEANKLEAEYRVVRSFQQVDKKVGKMRNLGKIIVSQGGRSDS
jgi:hypothetical protein